MPTRGKYQFEVTPDGALVDSDANAERLQNLWLDRSEIDMRHIGPGDPGDFDDGAWHVACHLLGAGGVIRLSDARLAWLELSHEKARDDYYPSVTIDGPGGPITKRLEATGSLIAGATVLGFVEGNSTGHIS